MAGDAGAAIVTVKAAAGLGVIFTCGTSKALSEVDKKNTRKINLN